MKKFKIALVQIQKMEQEVEASSVEEAKEKLLEQFENDEIEFVYVPTKVHLVDMEDDKVRLPEDDEWTVDLEY